MTYPPYPQQPGGDGYQHPENDHGGYANPQYQQQQYSGCQTLVELPMEPET